jgi:hypothetical protein
MTAFSGVNPRHSRNPIDRLKEIRKMNEPIGAAARMKQGAANRSHSSRVR